MMKRVLVFLIWLMCVFIGECLLTKELKGIDHQFGASIRWRYELWDNVVSLGFNETSNTNKDRNFLRLRIQVWDNIILNNSTNLYMRIATEPRYHMGPNYLVLKDGKRRKFDQDEVFVDNLYLDLKRPLGLPLNLRIGRQDFLGKDMYGEGFLILDGTPADGSRSFYFNAFKATLLLNENNTVDIVFVSNPQRDVYLPSIHPSYDDGRNINYINHKRRLTGSNERGFWIYGRHKFGQLTLEPYYIYKKEEKSQILNFSSYVHTLGTRIVYRFGDMFLRGEIAKEWGEFGDGTDRSGLGGYIFIGKKFPKCPVKPEVELGYVYLSGDDPKTKKDEGFNPLFSRAPQWNELLIYTYIYETRSKGGPIPGYWTNLKAPILNLKLYPYKNTELKIGYQKLFAEESVGKGNMFGDGKNRGDLVYLILNYRFNKNLTGLFQHEIFNPGNFYYKDAKTANFLRVQLFYQF